MSSPLFAAVTTTTTTAAADAVGDDAAAPPSVATALGERDAALGSSMLRFLARSQRSVSLLEGAAFSSPERSAARYDAHGDLVAVIAAVTLAVKEVGAIVRRTGLPDERARSGGDSSGDSSGGGGSGGSSRHRRSGTAQRQESFPPAEHRRLEEVANQIWCDALAASHRSCVLVSEELDEAVVLDEESDGKFAIAFDPITGLAAPPSPEKGAIFGIFRQLTSGEQHAGVRDVLQPARQLVCAGYALYGPSVVLFLSLGDGVHGFTLDGAMNDWVLTHPYVKTPLSGRLYSLNAGLERCWDEDTREALRRFQQSLTLGGMHRSLRRTGSMVADLHRILLFGGACMYPAHADRPRGEMKLLYEAGPLAFLVEQAGGRASTGRASLLDVQPRSVHDRVPAFMGSTDDIELMEQFVRRVYTDPMFELRRTQSIQDGVIRRSRSSEQGVTLREAAHSASKQGEDAGEELERRAPEVNFATALAPGSPSRGGVGVGGVGGVGGGASIRGDAVSIDVDDVALAESAPRYARGAARGFDASAEARSATTATTVIRCPAGCEVRAVDEAAGDDSDGDSDEHGGIVASSLPRRA